MNGALLFDKPILWTSHDAVDHLRRRTGLRRIGHAGSLDPMATGLVVMLLGGATRRCEEFMSLEKTYQGMMTLGLRTDTLDLEGRLASQSGVDATEQDVRRVAASFVGEIEQVPPAYSAIKVGGRKLYAMARSGQAVSIPPRRVTVRSLEILDYREPDIVFRLVCTKGTYVRSLAAEFGDKLGCGAVLAALSRCQIGPYSLSNAIGADALDASTGAELAARLF